MKRVLFATVLFLITAELSAQIKLPRLISNGMILQRDIPLKIWGWSAANESITVSFLNKEYSAQADKNGNWMITLPKQKAGGAYTMKLKASNEINPAGILIGDVWAGEAKQEGIMSRVMLSPIRLLFDMPGPTTLKNVICITKKDYQPPHLQLTSKIYEC